MADGFSGPRRRDLLGSSALVILGARALAAATGSILAGCGHDATPFSDLTDEQRAARVAAAYVGADSADRGVLLGNAYLAQLTPELDPDVIEADLAGFIDLIAASTDEAAALAAVEAAVADDFRGGAMVNLSGWSLSRNELRLCAVLSLSEGD